MGYLFLLLTILSESTAVLCMKASKGFHEKLYSVMAIAFYAGSFVFLSLALRNLPVGRANAIWAGASTILVAIMGILFFKETLSLVQWAFLALIVIGLVGLQWTASN